MLLPYDIVKESRGAYNAGMKIQELTEKAAPVLRSFGVSRASVFGSVARGEAGEKSDIDLLVRFGKPIGMIEYMRFVERMEKVLERPVDIVTEKSAAYLKPHIERDLQLIYEK